MDSRESVGQMIRGKSQDPSISTNREVQESLLHTHARVCMILANKIRTVEHAGLESATFSDNVSARKLLCM